MRSRRGISELLIDLVLLMIVLGISSGIVMYLHKNVITPSISRVNSDELSSLDCENLLAYKLSLRSGDAYLVVVNKGKDEIRYKIIINDEGRYEDSLYGGDYRVYLLKNIQTSNVVIICNGVDVVNVVNVG